MVASKLLRHGLLSAAFFSGAAGAIGLGEITLHSRIGEPLRAEVPIQSGGEPLDAACFSLAPLPGADFSVITAARTRLVRIGQDYRLIITGSKPIDEPVVAINLRASCGIDLQREYVMLPAPPATPVSTPQIEPAAVAVNPSPREVVRYRQPVERYSENAWPEDDRAPQPVAKPRPPRPAQTAAPKPKTPLPRDTLAGIAAGNDRVVLGAAPDELPPPGAGNPLAQNSELDERVLKMETTLHLLNLEVDKLSTAMTLGAESRALQQQLQAMQKQQAAPGTFIPSVQAAPPPAAIRSESSHDGWVELVLGLLLGGSVSAGVAHFVSRRQDNARPFDVPPPHIATPGPAKP